MKTPSIFSILTATALVGIGSTSAFAQVATPPVGFNSVTCPAGSDTRLSAPLCAEQPFAGAVNTATTTGAPAGQAIVSPTSTVAWTVDQFAGLYYIKVEVGTHQGMYFQIMANDASSLTVDLAGETLALTNGDTFKICKFWTLSTLFPPATQTTIVPSLGTLAFQRRTEVLIPDVASTGINLAPNRIFYLVGTDWKEAAAGNPSSNNFIIPPDSFFIVRHGNSNIVNPTTYTVVGGVDLTPNTTILKVANGERQDNAVTHGRPVPVKLVDLDLISSAAFVPSLGNLAFQRRDELLVYDNAASGVNKAPAAVYFYAAGNWKSSAAGNPISDDVEIGPSQGFVIRKYNGASASDIPWTQDFATN